MGHLSLPSSVTGVRTLHVVQKNVERTSISQHNEDDNLRHD